MNTAGYALHMVELIPAHECQPSTATCAFDINADFYCPRSATYRLPYLESVGVAYTWRPGDPIYTGGAQ